MTTSQQKKTTQFLLLTIPRSGCHLLDRMLSKQSNAVYTFHPLHDCLEPRLQWLYSTNGLEPMSGDIREQHEEARKKGLQTWQSKLKDAEKEGKILMNHTHPFHTISLDIIKAYSTSPGKLPTPPDLDIIPEASDLLLHPGTQPVFTVRDPRLVVASASRLLPPMGLTINTPILASVSPIWSRTLYDWFVSKGIQPIVVDADDYMTNPEFVRKLCREAGLKEEDVWFEWESWTRKEGMASQLEPVFDLMQQTLWKSSGANPNRAAKNMDIDALVKSWKNEFGEEAEKSMLEALRLEMPHYQYLYEKRLRP